MKKFKILGVALLAIIGVIAAVSMAQGGVLEIFGIGSGIAGAILAVPPVVSFKDLDPEQQKLLQVIEAQVKELVTDANKSTVSREDFEEKFNELKEALSELDGEKAESLMSKFNAISEKIASYDESISKIAEDFAAFQEAGKGKEGEKISLKQKLDEILASDDYKDFIAKKGDKKGSFSVPIDLKEVNLTGNYGPTETLITTRSDRTIVQPERSINIRDLIPVESTDLPYLVFDEVINEDYDIQMEGENDELAESAFEVQEVTKDVKRLGTFIDVSKRMLKAVRWLSQYLGRRLPEKLYRREDFQLLFGDGTGNNLLGVANDSVDFDLAGNTYAATDISSIATYNGGTQTLVNFAANHDLKNGDLITFANTTNYNDTFIAIVRTKAQILIDEAFTTESTAAWTGTSKNPFYQSIPNANYYDVLTTAKALQKRGEYMVNGIALNPVDAAKIEQLKATTAEYLGIIRGADGVLRITGTPVVETTAVPAGKFIVGDWQNAAGLLELTSANITFTDDVSYAKRNKICVIIEEEIIFPIYNKYQFMYGDFAAALTELTEPA